jgi:hypothetical protein
MLEESTDHHYEIDLNSSTLINESFTDTAMEPMEVNFSSSITDSMAIETRSTTDTAMEVDVSTAKYIDSCDSTVSHCVRDLLKY